MDALKTKVTEIEGEIARAERKRDDARATLEQQKAEEAHHKKTEEDALLLIDDLDGEYGIKTSTAAATGREPPAYKAKAATEALSRVLQSRQAELAQAKDKRQHYSSTQGTKVQQLRVKIDHTSEAATQKEKEAADHQMRLRNLQQRVEGGEMAEADETALSRLRQESRDLKAQVEMAEEDVSSSGLSSDIANGKIKRRALKDKLVALNEELANIEREGDKQKKLKTQSEAVQEKKDKLESVITDRRPKLAQVLDVPHNDDVMRLLEMDSIAREMLRRRQQKDDDVLAKETEAKQAHEKYTRKQNEVYVKQEALRTAEDEVQRVEGELSSIDSLMLTEGYDWEGQQKEMEEKVEEISDRKFGGAQMIKFVEKAIEKAEASATCVLCNQKCDAAAKGSIKKRADQIRDKAINLPGQSETDLHEARTKANKHKRAHEQFLACKKQKNSEIPATQQMLDKLKGEQMTLKREHERLLGEVKELRERSERAKELMRDVDHVKYLYKELQAAQGEFAHTQSGMQSGMHSAVRPKEVVVSERDQAQEDLEQCEKELDEKGNAIEGKRNELAECRARASAKELELSKVVSAMERMKELQTQISDTQQRMSKLQQEARSLRDGERPDREKLHAQENELRAEEQRLDAAVKQHDDRVAKCITDHTKLTDYSNRLSEGSSASRQQMMQDCKARHDEAERTVAGKRDSLKETQKRKEEMADRIKGQDRLQMQMRANLQYRDLLAKERAKKDEMMKSQAALSKADPKANQSAQEYNKLQAKMRDLETERAKFEGSKTTVTRNVENIKVQLKEKQYKRIDAEHREKLIEHKTVQMAVEDLNRYYKALNAALMRFHETKMADINKSITELWNKTYKGSDIDGIAIKTEDEGQTADGRRKQTYRVVMRKGDSTLDMRGRCSAGQKVLASLVIRLALAETFCINCGIMTLDEPTTNLDRANIESLANAINEIIKQRKQQANFQLLVITHDEEFVQLIGRGENCSHYYWVEKRFLKEGDPPCSTITKKSIDRFG